MLGPVICNRLGLDLDASKDIVGQVRLESSREAAVVRTLHPEGAGVLLLLDVHAPVTLVLEANETSAVRRANTHRSGESIGQWLAQELDAQARAIDGLVVVGVHRVVVAELEGAVLDELGVDTAVSTVVDVLVEEAIAVVDTKVLCRVASRRADFDRGCGNGSNAACGQHGLVYQAHCERIESDCATQGSPEELRLTGGILTACFILPQAIGDEVRKVLAAAIGVIVVQLHQAWQL
jgi:hypothetical protein